MRFATLFIALFFSISAFSSTPLIVETVKDQKATVYVPVNVNVKPGDMLYTESQKQTETSQSILTDKSTPTGGLLRKRTHNLALEFANNTIKVKTKDTSVTVDGRSIGAAYFYNLGFIEVGVAASTAVSDSTAKKSTITQTIFALKGNLIKNEPGNDWIPFGVLGFGKYLEDIDDRTSANSDNVTDGNVLGLGLGLSWFPFGELFSIEISATHLRGSLSYSGNPDIGSKSIDAEKTTFSISYVLSF